MIKEFTLPTAKCIRCEYVWTPRKPHPVMCPHCNSPFWDKPRVNEGNYISKKVTSINLGKDNLHVQTIKENR
jgi:DNA-directed RNA polymerase subunit RPC12/RpoP